jgi:DNA-binding transcriptional regulator YhcF (GntR family)
VTREEIKNVILRRAYHGAFEEGVKDYFNLYKYAEENGINRDEADRAFNELEEAGLIQTYAGGGVIINTSAGLMYAEQHNLADEALIDKHTKVRIKMLEALADAYEKSPDYEMEFWEEWFRLTDINEQDFNKNYNYVIDTGLVKISPMQGHILTQAGNSIVIDYRRLKRRLEDFERLDKLEGMTEQQRGHKLEDLLAETAEWEGWEVTKRVRSQGQENDIIIHKGPHYFLISCKWAEPIQPHVVELLESRVRSRAQTNGGILFTMSGFTPNCIEEIRLKIATALIIPFGPGDIKRIMGNEISLTDLLDDKIDQVMNHRQILVDGELK